MEEQLLPERLGRLTQQLGELRRSLSRLTPEVQRPHADRELAAMERLRRELTGA